MKGQALQNAEKRVRRQLRNWKSMRELVMSNVASREIVMSCIRDARAAGEVVMRYRENGEPEYLAN